MNTVACIHCRRVVPLVLVKDNACPNCGQDVRASDPIPPPLPATPPMAPVPLQPRRVARSTAKQDESLAVWITLFLVAVPVILFLFYVAKPSPPPKPETREQKLEKHFSPWDGSHRAVTAAITKSMNDPNSYEHDSTIYVDKGDTLIIKTVFRGKNKFGGVVKTAAYAQVDLNGNVLSMNFVPQ